MKVAVWGANGRVGKQVCRLAQQRGHTVVPVENGAPTQKVDFVVDFSLPEATFCLCEYCKKNATPLVTGVTGRNQLQQNAVDNLKKYVKVAESCNFSKGVAMLKELCLAASRLGWDCEIVEIHRKNKIDAPSGTAKEIAKSLGNVPVHSLRCGSNFGMHQVVFATNGESLTLTHQAENVDIFALGALETGEKLAKG